MKTTLGSLWITREHKDCLDLLSFLVTATLVLEVVLTRSFSVGNLVIIIGRKGTLMDWLGAVILALEVVLSWSSNTRYMKGI